MAAAPGLGMAKLGCPVLTGCCCCCPSEGHTAVVVRSECVLAFAARNKRDPLSFFLLAAIWLIILAYFADYYYRLDYSLKQYSASEKCTHSIYFCVCGSGSGSGASRPLTSLFFLCLVLKFCAGKLAAVVAVVWFKNQRISASLCLSSFTSKEGGRPNTDKWRLMVVSEWDWVTDWLTEWLNEGKVGRDCFAFG